MLRFIITAITILFFSANTLAQTNGILPFTGIKYFRNGIWGKEIETTLDGHTWAGNHLPINTEYEIKLVEPRGFTEHNGKFYPGIKVLLLDAKKDTLMFSPNIFKKNENIGMDDYALKSLSLSLGFNDKVKPGDTCYQYITFFDTKGFNKLLLEFPVVIADAKDSLQISTQTYSASSTRGYNAKACGGIELHNIEVYMDSIYFPNSLYHSIRFAKLLGLTPAEVDKGKFQTWVYDEQLKILPYVKDPKQYAVKYSTESDEINLLVQIPLNPSDKKNKDYIARYRWESSDGKKVLDVVNNFLF